MCVYVDYYFIRLFILIIIYVVYSSFFFFILKVPYYLGVYNEHEQMTSGQDNSD